jgi:Regulator of Ty1 transposition protein 107 BRCT domain/twin BRCT domain
LTRFDDCLRLGKRISVNPYLHPNPAVLQADWRGPPVSRASEDIDGASSYMPSDYPPAVLNPQQRRPLKVFRNKKLQLGADLNISANLQKAIKDLVEGSGGELVKSVRQADIYICHYRDGSDYVQASQEGKTVVNLAWLFHVITRDLWTSPMRRLMHYPIPRHGVEGFENTLISISNYTGEARVYLQFLVQALGGTFTKVMRQENTHLIVAHVGSEKCDAAREWDIEIVNHLWLEDSYVKCKMQRISDPRYNHFPTRTNLGEIVGQTQLDRGIIEAQYYPRAVAKTPRTRKAPAVQVPAEDDFVPVAEETTAVDALQEVDNMDVDEPAPTKVQKAKRVKSDTALRTPASRRVTGIDKENDTPGTTGSRGAKDRAMNKLHAAAADIALFNKEMKRVGGVTHGRDRIIGTEQSEEKEHGKRRKRKSDEAEQEDDDDSRVSIDPAATHTRKGKKAKTEKLPPIAHRLMVTFWERWQAKPDLETGDRNKLRNLGLHVVDDPSNVTILCAPKIVRTKKFICALACAPHVVSTQFLDDCLKLNKMPNINKYVISDRDSEEKLGFKLLRALERADENKHRFLKGWQIFCTEKVPGGFDTFNEIVKANGGMCTLYKGRTNLHVSKRSFDRFAEGDPVAESQRDDKGDTLYLISGTSKAEIDLWDKFRAQASKADMVPVIAKSDWLLSVAMSQKFRWEDQWELNEASVPSPAKR